MGYCLKYDVSLRTDSYQRLVDETRHLMENSAELTREEKDSIEAFGYGHLGDGNLHLNISCTGYEDKALQEKLNNLVDPFIMDFVRKANGSVSAEHGVGL